MTVIGAYPSALHVQWDPPEWARTELRVGPVASLAVSNEPTVFWDGADADRLVEQWRDEVGFRTGTGRSSWGRVHAAGNGTSGRPVTNRVLRPLGIEPPSVGFTDVVNSYFVKRNGHSGNGRQQGDAIDQDYNVFAAAQGLPIASLPTRPSIGALAAQGVGERRERLRAEVAAAAAGIVVTLGEEARRVLAAIVDDCNGEPTQELRRDTTTSTRYGTQGSATLNGLGVRWIALVHPGQRNQQWASIHNAPASRGFAKTAHDNTPSTHMPIGRGVRAGSAVVRCARSVCGGRVELSGGLADGVAVGLAGMRVSRRRSRRA